MTSRDLEVPSFWGNRPVMGSTETIEELDSPDIDERVKHSVPKAYHVKS